MRRSIGALKGVAVGPTVFFATRASCACTWNDNARAGVTVALKRNRLR